MKLFTAGLTALLTLTAVAVGQSGGPFQLTSSTIDGGGETFSVGGTFRLGGTIGQPDPDTLVGGAFVVNGGFWPGLCGGDVASYGVGTPGSGGFVPSLGLVGCPSNGETVQITVNSVLGSAPGLLAIGTAPAMVPLFGGTLLTFPISKTQPFFTGGAPGVPGAGSGTSAVFFNTNAALVGLTVYIQAGFLDAGAPGGFSFSDGLAVTIG